MRSGASVRYGQGAQEVQRRETRLLEPPAQALPSIPGREPSSVFLELTIALLHDGQPLGLCRGFGEYGEVPRFRGAERRRMQPEALARTCWTIEWVGAAGARTRGMNAARFTAVGLLAQKGARTFCVPGERDEALTLGQEREALGLAV